MPRAVDKREMTFSTAMFSPCILGLEALTHKFVYDPSINSLLPIITRLSLIVGISGHIGRRYTCHRAL